VKQWVIAYAKRRQNVVILTPVIVIIIAITLLPTLVMAPEVDSSVILLSERPSMIYQMNVPHKPIQSSDRMISQLCQITATIIINYHQWSTNWFSKLLLLLELLSIS